MSRRAWCYEGRDDTAQTALCASVGILTLLLAVVVCNVFLESKRKVDRCYPCGRVSLRVEATGVVGEG